MNGAFLHLQRNLELLRRCIVAAAAQVTRSPVCRGASRDVGPVMLASPRGSDGPTSKSGVRDGEFPERAFVAL